MNIDLKVMEYAVKFYRDEELSRRFSLIDYYALSDISPKELAAVARKQKSVSTSVALVAFDNNTYYGSRPVNMAERLTCFHSVKGYELTVDDKMAIYDKLSQEGYPLMTGIYDVAARYYVMYGIDSISKENIRGKIIESYNTAKGISTVKEEKSNVKVLVK